MCEYCVCDECLRACIGHAPSLSPEGANDDLLFRRICHIFVLDLTDVKKPEFRRPEQKYGEFN